MIRPTGNNAKRSCPVPPVSTYVPSSSFQLPLLIPTSLPSTISNTVPTVQLQSSRNQSSPGLGNASNLLHPTTLEVLQRTEAQSNIDVESYVRALGDKKYAVVKKIRKAQLLDRAKAQKRTAHLDDKTVRKQTNLASANASRAKKEYIMDELQSLLKQKWCDTEILAGELRKMMSLVDRLTAANRCLQLQQHQQQQVGQNSVNEKILKPGNDARGSMEERFLSGTDGHPTALMTNDNFGMDVYEQGGLCQDEFGLTPVAATNNEDFAAAVKMADISESDIGFDCYAGDEKMGAQNGSFSMGLVPEIQEYPSLYSSNPSNQFTVAG